MEKVDKIIMMCRYDHMIHYDSIYSSYSNKRTSESGRLASALALAGFTG
jgi:hypothetical protein